MASAISTASFSSASSFAATSRLFPIPTARQTSTSTHPRLETAVRIGVPLLCHKFHLWLRGRRRRQHGHRERGLCNRKGQRTTDRGDRVGNVSLRSERGRLGVGNHWEGDIFRLERRNVVLRGESSPVRRSGNRRLRLRAYRDGGSRASGGPHSAPGRFPA